MDALRHDFWFGMCSFLRNPGFSAVSVLTLALGIEATTAIFSVIYAVLLLPFPYPAAERMTVLGND